MNSKGKRITLNLSGVDISIYGENLGDAEHLILIKTVRHFAPWLLGGEFLIDLQLSEIG